MWKRKVWGVLTIKNKVTKGSVVRCPPPTNQLGQNASGHPHWAPVPWPSYQQNGRSRAPSPPEPTALKTPPHWEDDARSCPRSHWKGPRPSIPHPHSDPPRGQTCALMDTGWAYFGGGVGEDSWFLMYKVQILNSNSSPTINPASRRTPAPPGPLCCPCLLRAKGPQLQRDGRSGSQTTDTGPPSPISKRPLQPASADQSPPSGGWSQQQLQVSTFPDISTALPFYKKLEEF